MWLSPLPYYLCLIGTFSLSNSSFVANNGNTFAVKATATPAVSTGHGSKALSSTFHSAAAGSIVGGSNNFGGTFKFGATPAAGIGTTVPSSAFTGGLTASTQTIAKTSFGHNAAQAQSITSYFGTTAASLDGFLPFSGMSQSSQSYSSQSSTSSTTVDTMTGLFGRSFDEF